MNLRKIGMAALAAISLAGTALVISPADARPGHGHMSMGPSGGGRISMGGPTHYSGGTYSRSYGGRYYGGRRYGGGFGPGFIGGLALGTGLGYGWGYPGYAAYAYDDGYYGDCYLQRRVRYTPWGPVVRRVRVCY
jgi:hypothetical protein